MQFPMFEALARGCITSVDFLGLFPDKNRKEIPCPLQQLITFEQGIRFLPDYLSGDACATTITTLIAAERMKAQLRDAAVGVEANVDNYLAARRCRGETVIPQGAGRDDRR